jgi:hypothetical protein
MAPSSLKSVDENMLGDRVVGGRGVVLHAPNHFDPSYCFSYLIHGNQNFYYFDVVMKFYSLGKEIFDILQC